MSVLDDVVPARLVLIVLLGGLVVGCTDLQSPRPDEGDISARSSSSVDGRPPGNARVPRSVDEIMASLARRTPGGFGGMFVGDDGQVRMYLTKPGVANEAVPAVVDAFQRETGRRLRSDEVVVLKGDHSFSTLHEWHREILGVLRLDGVIRTDVDDRNNRLEVAVSSQAARRKVAESIATLPVPDEAVHVAVEEPIRRSTSVDDRVRPVRGGLKIDFEPGSSCTLGFNADHHLHGTTFVTASHCTAVQGGVESTDYFQATSLDASDHIGVEVMDPEYWVGTHPETGDVCPSGKRCRYSDAALVKYDAGVNADLGGIVRTEGLGSLTIDPSEPRSMVTGDNPRAGCWYVCSLVGDTVHKIGHTTGWTKGVILFLGANTNVAGSDVHLMNQVGASYASAGGDSGSGVWDVSFCSWCEDPAVGLYGVHWGAGGGASAWFSYIGWVKSDLGRDFSLECDGFRTEDPDVGCGI